MIEKIPQNAWILKEKELLEKLSQEISRDFSIWEKLAKRLIYKTHLSLWDLREEIHLDNKGDNTPENSNDNLDDNSLNRLLWVLDWVRKLIEQASKNEIQELKDILENSDLALGYDSEIVKNIFSKKVINRAKYPKNMSDQIIWVTLWIANSAIIITEVLYSLWKWIITSIPDLISILKWEGEIESFKKV